MAPRKGTWKDIWMSPSLTDFSVDATTA